MRSYSYAGFWARLAAFLIDGVLVLLGQSAVRFALFLSFGIFADENPLNHTFLFQYTWKDGILYAAGVCYFVLLTYYGGSTLGKKALNLQVVSADGEKLTFFDVLYRETIGRFLSAFVLCIGYIMAGVTNEKTALHDILCDTRVVYAKKIPTYLNGDINKRYEQYAPQEKETGECNKPEQKTQVEPKESPEPSVSQAYTPAQPARVVETSSHTINIYDRYQHVNPNEQEKE